MTDQSQQDRQIVKRPRPVLSCLECRRKKLKCDRLLPCQQCLKLNQPSLCKYAPGQEPEARENATDLGLSKKRIHYDTIDQLSPANHEQIDELQDRVRRLEHALRTQQASQATLSPPEAHGFSAGGPVARRDTPDPDSLHYHAADYSRLDDDFLIFEKFEDAIRFSKSLRQRQDDAQLQAISSQLLALQKSTANSDMPNRNRSIVHNSATAIVNDMALRLPPLEVREKLIDLYFENFHHCARVINRSAFKTQYGFFKEGAFFRLEFRYFVPTLLGMLSIASTLNTFPECEVQRKQEQKNGGCVSQLIEEWFGLIVEQDGLTIAALRVRLLGLQSKRYRTTDLGSFWPSSAPLIRQAMILGLHKEPDSTVKDQEAEFRRCLWLTILEFDLAAAIACEMPPICPTYDLKYPLAANDDDIENRPTSGLIQRPPDQWTDGLCQNIVAKSFNLRLEAYKHRFLPKSSSHYAKSLKYARSLEMVLRNLPSLFRLDHLANNAVSRLMAQMDLDILLRRSITAIYAPYARAMPQNDAFQEARINWVQSHLVLMCFQDLFDPQYPGIDVPQPIGYWDFFWTTYHFETIQSLEAMLLEGQFLQRLKRNSLDQHSLDLPNESLDSAVKRMRWDINGIIKSIEDTLEPMTRRLKLSGGDLRELARYSVLACCLRSLSPEIADKAITEGLGGLVSSLQSRLNREPMEDGNTSANGSEGVDWLWNYLGLER